MSSKRGTNVLQRQLEGTITPGRPSGGARDFYDSAEEMHIPFSGHVDVIYRSRSNSGEVFSRILEYLCALLAHAVQELARA